MTSVSTEKMTEVSEEQDVSGMFEGSEEAFENDESEESLYGESSKRKRKGGPARKRDTKKKPHLGARQIIPRKSKNSAKEKIKKVNVEEGQEII